MQVGRAKLICRSFQVESHPEKYRGDYEYTVVLVGANNLGRRNVQSSVTCVKKIMGILSDLNPAAMALACEVITILKLKVITIFFSCNNTLMAHSSFVFP